MASHLTERQFLLSAEGLVSIQNLEDGSFEVHSVVVNKLVTFCNQIVGLLYTKLDTIGLDCLIVCLDFFETNKNFFRHLGLSEFAHSVEAVVTENRHDSRNDLTLDACETAIPDPIVENLIVEEELGNDEISSSIHLFLQVANVVLSRRGLQMHFGVPSHTDAEEISVFLTNVFN